MKTVAFTAGKLAQLLLPVVFIFTLACSTVREQGEPDVTDTKVITTDEQRRAIYDRGGNFTPQNANPIPTSEQLGLDEKASETNRKRNIEEGGNVNAPSNKPTEERPRQLPNTGNDTIYR